MNGCLCIESRPLCYEIGTLTSAFLSCVSSRFLIYLSLSFFRSVSQSTFIEIRRTNINYLYMRCHFDAQREWCNAFILKSYKSLCRYFRKILWCFEFIDQQITTPYYLTATIDSGSGKWRVSDWISEDFAVADVRIAKYLWVLYASTSWPCKLRYTLILLMFNCLTIAALVKPYLCKSTNTYYPYTPYGPCMGVCITHS